MKISKIVVICLFFCSSVVFAGTKEDLAKCAAINSDASRLICYDNLAKSLGVDKQKTKISTGKGKWRVREDISPIDDSVNVYLSVALLGHWITHEETQDTHYYVADENFTMVEGSGRRMEMTYRVLESNENQNWIRIRVKTAYDVGHDKHLQFTADRKSLTETTKRFEEYEYSIPSQWIYVDDRQSGDTILIR